MVSYVMTIAKINRTIVTKMYKAWLAGATKEEAEAKFLGVKNAKGKTFSRVVWDYLEVETEDIRAVLIENQKLKNKISTDNFNRYQKV